MPNRPQLVRLMEIDRRVRAGEYPSPDGLASDLGVSRRVIFKDRAFLLNECHAPLAHSRERGGWYYTESTWALPAIIASRGEVLAFLLAVEAAQRQLGPVLENELHGAVRKLGAAVSGQISVDLEQLRRHFTFAAPAAAVADSNTLLSLKEAIERRRVVNMRYFNAHRNVTERRRVQPYHLHHSGGDWYLINFDLDREAYRRFNVARVGELRVENASFIRRLDFDADRYLQAGFRTESGPEIFDVEVRFDAQQAPYIRERVYHPTQTLEELPDGGVLLRFSSSGIMELTRWVLQYGPHADILKPVELREAVVEAVRGMVGVYGSNL